MSMFLPLCAKSSDLLVCLVSCTINTESVLNLSTTKTDMVSCFLPHLCRARLVMSVVLYTVQCTCCWVKVLNDSVDGDDLVCSVSNMTPLLWSVHVHMVSALYYSILTSSLSRLILYGLSLYPSEPYRMN